MSISAHRAQSRKDQQHYKRNYHGGINNDMSPPSYCKNFLLCIFRFDRFIFEKEKSISHLVSLSLSLSLSFLSCFIYSVDDSTESVCFSGVFVFSIQKPTMLRRRMIASSGAKSSSSGGEMKCLAENCGG